MAMTDRRRQLLTVLNQFYEQPVARTSFELLISVAVILFFAVFAIRPTLLTMSDLIKEIEDKRKLDQALNQKIAALSTAQSEYVQLEERLMILDEAIPSNPDLIDTLKILEKIASDRGLVISTLRVSDIPTQPEDDVAFTDLERQNLLMSLTVTGDYPTIREFVEDLRQSRRTFIVESVTFSTGDEQGTKVLRANMTINSPYYGLPAVSPVPGAAL